MLGYLFRRTLAAIPVMLLVAVAVFSLLELSPGDPAELIAGDTATPEQIAAIREALLLDQPLVPRFVAWLSAILHGDLGVSLFSRVPITTLIAQRLEPTLMLTLTTLILVVLISVPLGVIAAVREGTIVDRAVTLLSVVGFSLPVFIVGYGLAAIFAVQLNWLPSQGYTPLSQGFGACLRSLILPSITLGCVYIALITRVSRASVLEVLNEDYLRTARAKGVPWFPILIRHALPNAAIPILTVIGFGLGAMLGGVVVTETVFNLPGLGRLTAESILRRDYPVIQALTLLFAAVYVLVNLLVDLSYGLIDPRVRYS